MEKLEKHDIDLVVLAGYMRILTPKFVKNYPHAIINLHPALLPSSAPIKSAFKGEFIAHAERVLSQLDTHKPTQIALNEE